MQCREKTVRGKVLEIALRLLCKTYSTDNAACRDERCALLRNTSWGHCEYCSRARGDSGWTDGHCVSGGHTPLALHSSGTVCTVAVQCALYHTPLICKALALCALYTVPHSLCSVLEIVVLHTFCGTLLYHTFITFADHLEPADPAFGP